MTPADTLPFRSKLAQSEEAHLLGAFVRSRCIPARASPLSHHALQENRIVWRARFRRRSVAASRRAKVRPSLARPPPSHNTSLQPRSHHTHSISVEIAMAQASSSDGSAVFSAPSKRVSFSLADVNNLLAKLEVPTSPQPPYITPPPFSTNSFLLSPTHTHTVVRPSAADSRLTHAREVRHAVCSEPLRIPPYAPHLLRDSCVRLSGGLDRLHRLHHSVRGGDG